MGVPKNPNTSAATEANIRRGQDRQAAKLRDAGWDVTPPEDRPAVQTQTKPAVLLTAAEAKAVFIALTATAPLANIYPGVREADAAGRAYRKLRDAGLEG